MRVDDAMSLEEILRTRPLAVELLERAAGYRLWISLTARFGDFCENEGLDAPALRASLADLPVPDVETDWDSRPVYVLLDFLTQDHARFRGTLLSVSAELAGDHRSPASGDGKIPASVEEGVRAFEKEFLGHLAEEEHFLFPKIMRNEACFRHFELFPEVYKGSVNLYLSTNRHDPEIELRRVLSGMREKARREKAGGLSGPLERVIVALETLDREMERHLSLENGRLFPRAGRLEQELYEGLVPGLSRFPGDR